jgi:hypothetical protein
MAMRARSPMSRISATLLAYGAIAFLALVLLAASVVVELAMEDIQALRGLETNGLQARLLVDRRGGFRWLCRSTG